MAEHFIYVMSGDGEVVAAISVYADGHQDDAASFLKAEELALKAGEDAWVRVPPGEYTVSEPVGRVLFRGDGPPSATVLRDVARDRSEAAEARGEA